MANPSSAVDLHQSAAAYLAANEELYALKVNRLARWLPIDARARAVAQWSNLVDDFMLEAQALLRLQRNGSGSPEASVAAEVGTLYLNTEASPTGSRLWVKATGTGTTGWSQVGGLEAGDVTLDLIEDAPAVSVLARAGNTTGVRADLASGGARRFLASDATNTAIAFRILAAGDFPTGPGVIPPGALDNGLALSVLGVTGGSGAARADIVSGGSRRALMSDGSNAAVAFRALEAADVPALGYIPTTFPSGGTVLVDIDCTADATVDWNAGGDGNYSLGGFTWAILNTGVADTLGPVNGTGLRFNSSASATVYTNASRTACNLRIAALTLLPTFVPWGRYLFEFYCSAITLGTSVDMVMMGLFADQPGTDHVMVGGRRNTAGNQETATTLQASTLGIGYTDNCFGVLLDVHGVTCLSGTYASDFVYTHQGGYQSNGANNTGCFDTSLAQVVIAFPTSSSGNVDVTIARIRVRRVG